ncbi:MAG TPA: glycosyltransferase family 39 protein [Phycisphaerae bacterium]|nr:glycosyltransferase family 39 protein [Phycisphaerae bacterium]
MKIIPAHRPINERPRRGQATTLLIAVALIALPLRLYVALNAEMISRDGAVFIWYAQGLQRDWVGELRAQKQHPLYPAMVLGAHQILQGTQSVLRAPAPDPVRTWIAAAVSVSLIGGLAVVVAAYCLGRVLFDFRVGLIAALLAAVAAEFCQLSGDALTDMPHLAVYLLALAAAARGLRDRQHGWLVLAGLLSGVAYLIRPEGAEVAVVAAAGGLLIGRAIPLKQRAVAAVLVCLGAGLVASPYMAVTGKLVPKKSVKQLFRGQAHGQPLAVPNMDRRLAANRPGPHLENRDNNLSIPLGALTGVTERDAGMLGSVPADLGRAWGRIGENWARSLRVTLLLPAVWWLVVRRRRPCEPVGGRLAGGAMILHLVILTALIVHFDYWRLFSLRHVMILAGLTLPFAAAGIAAVLDAVPAHRQNAAMVALAVGLIGPTLPWMLETRFADEVHIRQAGEWIRAHDDNVPRVMTTRFRAALYANGVAVWCPPEPDPERVLAEARWRRPTWMVFETETGPARGPDFLDALYKSTVAGERLERVRRVAGRGPEARSAVVFRYHAPP